MRNEPLLHQSDAARMLADFHEAFAHPNTDALWLRPTLHDEEHAELIEALESGDKAAVARELADVLYIAYGTAHVYGIDLDAALAEVHRANMSKLAKCDACGGDGFGQHDEAGHAVMNDDWTADMCEPCDGRGRVALRREDGKILKGPDFSPPDMTKVVGS